MSNVSYSQALSILNGWPGSVSVKWDKWVQTYDTILPPPPPMPNTVEELAQYIADNYTGPVIT